MHQLVSNTIRSWALLSALCGLATADDSSDAPTRDKHPERIVLEDSLQGTTKGDLRGGTLSPDGFQPSVGLNYIAYTLPETVSNGSVQFEIRGMQGRPELTRHHEHGFFAMYDGRNIAEPIDRTAFNSNFYRFQLLYREGFMAQFQTAPQKEPYLSLDQPVFPRERAYRASLYENQRGENPQRMHWDKDRWYTIKVEWNQGEVTVFRDGQAVVDRHSNIWWQGKNKAAQALGLDQADIRTLADAGELANDVWPMPWPYAPRVHRLWLGSSGPRAPSRVPGVIYRNLRVVSYDDVAN